MRKISFLALLLAASLFAFLPTIALAGGGGGGGGPCAGFGTGTRLTIRDSCFDGVAQFAGAGDTLTVTNEGNLPHSFTAVDGSFDTGILDPGESAEIPLEADEIVRVYCTLHGTASGSGMAGVLIVGQPALQTAGGGDPTGELKSALAARDAALLGEIQAQSKTLAGLRADVTGVQQAIEATSKAAASPIQPVQATAVGGLGVALGGGALAVSLWRRRSAAGGEPRTQGAALRPGAPDSQPPD